ncbi:MAG: hypothetical protein HY559_01065 [Gammaproteobacteria bacterium]|nr:hypothetical protein [Gammaproteobacteria bacterium]
MEWPLLLLNPLFKVIVRWLTQEEAPPPDFPLSDFERLRYEVRSADIILVEGRSRVSEIIKRITQSAWSHAALYIGRLHDLRDESLRARVRSFYSGEPHEPLIIESVLGKGTVVTPLAFYRRDHVRICRPKGISPVDAEKVVAYGIRRLGTEYDARQLFDLARFFLPWGILPRRWRSSLFERTPGPATKLVCSTMIAEAFNSVRYPILPLVKVQEGKILQLVPIHPRLMIPKDFDYSPYFDIIKYPFISIDLEGVYQKLPWGEENEFAKDRKQFSAH